MKFDEIKACGSNFYLVYCSPPVCGSLLSYVEEYRCGLVGRTRERTERGDYDAMWGGGFLLTVVCNPRLAE
jgi:hypothetical protein